MVTIIEVDFENEAHCAAVVNLMNHYMTDKMGGAEAHNKESAIRLIEGLRKQTNKLCLLALKDNKYVGLTNCFIGFGTFAAKPFINIHDIVVQSNYRGSGIGRALLEKVTEYAEKMDCGKITLEVREDNKTAQSLYKSVGYDECNPVMHFWTKYLSF